ncbi:hypothetical protein [Amycolatopsis sp. NPDC059021]|uniref:hypothetical protein n=1 Tax=Amycolatopsis sp. NPDC059021 TaxID=3346704 RepID=UPI00366D72FB
MTDRDQRRTQDRRETVTPPAQPMTLAEALADEHPLIRYQARQQRLLDAGERPLSPEAMTSADLMRELWQRNRDRIRGHRLLTATHTRR